MTHYIEGQGGFTGDDKFVLEEAAGEAIADYEAVQGLHLVAVKLGQALIDILPRENQAKGKDRFKEQLQGHHEQLLRLWEIAAPVEPATTTTIMALTVTGGADAAITTRTRHGLTGR